MSYLSSQLYIKLLRDNLGRITLIQVAVRNCEVDYISFYHNLTNRILQKKKNLRRKKKMNSRCIRQPCVRQMSNRKTIQTCARVTAECDGDDGEREEERTTGREAGKGLEKHRGGRWNNRINCFLKKGYDRSERLSRCGIAINSSPRNATGQVVERGSQRTQAREVERSADLREEVRKTKRGREKMRDVCRCMDKFVAKYRNIDTPLVSINVVKIYCCVVSDIYIAIASLTRHISL